MHRLSFLFPNLNGLFKKGWKKGTAMMVFIYFLCFNMHIIIKLFTHPQMHSFLWVYDININLFEALLHFVVDDFYLRICFILDSFVNYLYNIQQHITHKSCYDTKITRMCVWKSCVSFYGAKVWSVDSQLHSLLGAH